jgi:Zn-dependent peptidase ImmA (M78 family)
VNEPTDTQRAGIDGALALWRGDGVATMSVVDAAAAGAGTIELRFETAGLPFHGLYDDETGIVYINRAIEDLTPLSIVIAHELGHSFGLPHVDTAERRSLMNPGNFVTPPTTEDRAAIEALWGRCEEAPP